MRPEKLVAWRALARELWQSQQVQGGAEPPSSPRSGSRRRAIMRIGSWPAAPQTSQPGPAKPPAPVPIAGCLTRFGSCLRVAGRSTRHDPLTRLPGQYIPAAEEPMPRDQSIMPPLRGPVDSPTTLRVSGSYRLRHPSADHREPAMGHTWATSHEL